jgi:hypothetical protein
MVMSDFLHKMARIVECGTRPTRTLVSTCSHGCVALDDWTRRLEAMMEWLWFVILIKCSRIEFFLPAGVDRDASIASCFGVPSARARVVCKGCRGERARPGSSTSLRCEYSTPTTSSAPYQQGEDGAAHSSMGAAEQPTATRGKRAAYPWFFSTYSLGSQLL